DPHLRDLLSSMNDFQFSTYSIWAGDTSGGEYDHFVAHQVLNDRVAQLTRSAIRNPASRTLPATRIAVGPFDVGKAFVGGAYDTAVGIAYTVLDATNPGNPGAMERNAARGQAIISGKVITAPIDQGIGALDQLFDNDDPTGVFRMAGEGLVTGGMGRALGGVGSPARSMDSGIWRLGPGPRGEAIEQMLGHNLPGNFPVIDRFDNGIVTSIKSVDLDAASYVSGNGLQNALTRYVDKVAAFNGRTWAGRTIERDDILGRGLDLAIPHSGNVSQQAVINQAIKYGSTRGVTVNPIIFP
ncbi:MAG TPA: hypothetical protein VJM34_12045, partial [Novosphingobium sp.]|nr:hypothetical protein [Novosphingobium sp.]